MNTHADKTQKNKSKSVANAVSQKQSSSESTFQFVDNRPEAVAQRKRQEITNNSPQAKQAAQLQVMADKYTHSKHVVQLNSDTPAKRKTTAEMMMHGDRSAYRGRTADRVATAHFASTLRESNPTKDIAYLDELKRLKANERKQILKKIRQGQSPISITESIYEDETGNRSFKKETLQYLSDLMKTDHGLAFVKEILETEHTVELRKSDGGRNATMTKAQVEGQPHVAAWGSIKIPLVKNKRKPAKDAAVEKAQEADRNASKVGVGTSSVIEIDPSARKYGGGDEDWRTERPKFGLYHEMVHAYHKAKGTEAVGEYGGQKNREWQVMGFGPYSVEQFTENTIREAMGKDRRPDYDGHTY